VNFLAPFFLLGALAVVVMVAYWVVVPTWPSSTVTV